MNKSDDSGVVVVSGASRGLGLAVSQLLLKNGFRVAGFSRRATPAVEELSKNFESNYRFWELDIGNHDAIPGVVSEIEPALGNIFGLVNNAGFVAEGLLAIFSDEASNRIIDINLRGTLALTKQVARRMMVHRNGRIVNISSVVGIRGFTGVTTYAATKGALDAMTRTLARELGGRGVTVNSVAPGFMDTEMISMVDASERRRIQRRTPLGRLGTVDDVAGVIAFLMSESGSFISGQTIVVDGGMTC
jgi:3-oxoacyl-[acyl-carrier protein] reductase